MYSPLRGCLRVRILVFQITFSSGRHFGEVGQISRPYRASFIALPIPATAYTSALCGIWDPIERRQKKNRSVLAEFFKLHGLWSLSLDWSTCVSAECESRIKKENLALPMSEALYSRNSKGRGYLTSFLGMYLIDSDLKNQNWNDLGTKKYAAQQCA